jgi:hypothetical protein
MYTDLERDISPQIATSGPKRKIITVGVASSPASRPTARQRHRVRRSHCSWLHERGAVMSNVRGERIRAAIVGNTRKEAIFDGKYAELTRYLKKSLGGIDMSLCKCYLLCRLIRHKMHR